MSAERAEAKERMTRYLEHVRTALAENELPEHSILTLAVSRTLFPMDGEQHLAASMSATWFIRDLEALLEDPK